MLTFMSMRLLRAVLALAIVLTIAFVTVRYSGEPFERMFPEGLTVELEAQLRSEWFTDRSLIEQFGIYLGQIAQGDFGQSLYTKEEVWRIYADRMPATLAVGGLAFLVPVIIGIESVITGRV